MYVTPNVTQLENNHLITKAHDALITTSIFRFSTYENDLNVLNQSNTHKMTGDSKINLFGYSPTFHIRKVCICIWIPVTHLENILSANKLFAFINMKRKFVNSDNHKFHQYQ